ncbi:MAG TPA: DUF4440 domain-containing protein [Gemmatimonadaceae bacterium]|jgi:ketosteroid isomerase-like protein|nr:DUF4440 domain-containing protein [Gemmatimonadaceae bacterium]
MRISALLALVVMVSTTACSGSNDTAIQDSALASSAQQPAAGTDASQVRHVIDSATARFSDDAERGDAAGLMAMYAADAVVMQPNMPAWHGHDEIQKGWAGFLSSITIKELNLPTDDVLSSGDLAVQTGTYTLTAQPKSAGAQEMKDKGKYVVVWQKQADGSWKAVRDIFNSDLPAGGS